MTINNDVDFEYLLDKYTNCIEIDDNATIVFNSQKALRSLDAIEGEHN